MPNLDPAPPIAAVPEPGPTPCAPTLGQARAAYVGSRYPRFEASFELFDEAGGFRPTFHWPTLLFGFLWFVYRKMYTEAFLLFAGSLLLGVLAPKSMMSLGTIPPLAVSVLMALSARWLYWRAVDRKIEKAMSLYPRDPALAMQWLELKGGTALMAALLLLCVLTAMFALTLGAELADSANGARFR